MKDQEIQVDDITESRKILRLESEQAYLSYKVNKLKEDIDILDREYRNKLIKKDEV